MYVLGIYRPRALPSAGLFPFARSFLCDFKSTKTNDPSELLNGLPDLRSSRYIADTNEAQKIVSALHETVSVNIPTC